MKTPNNDNNINDKFNSIDRPRYAIFHSFNNYFKVSRFSFLKLITRIILEL